MDAVERIDIENCAGPVENIMYHYDKYIQMTFSSYVWSSEASVTELVPAWEYNITENAHRAVSSSFITSL